MYAIVADFVLKPSKYMHEPGSWRAVNFEQHHLVTWRAFHPSKWSAHYYGQVGGPSINAVQLICMPCAWLQACTSCCTALEGIGAHTARKLCWLQCTQHCMLCKLSCERISFPSVREAPMTCLHITPYWLTGCVFMYSGCIFRTLHLYGYILCHDHDGAVNSQGKTAPHIIYKED